MSDYVNDALLADSSNYNKKLKDESKALVNKWDKIEKSTNTMKNFTDEIRYQFRELDHYPVLFISSTTRQRINKVLET